MLHYLNDVYFLTSVFIKLHLFRPMLILLRYPITYYFSGYSVNYPFLFKFSLLLGLWWYKFWLLSPFVDHG